MSNATHLKDCHMCRGAYGLIYPGKIIVVWDDNTWHLCHECAQHEIWDEAFGRNKD